MGSVDNEQVVTIVVMYEGKKVTMADTFIHRYLRVPYTLHVYRHSRVKKARGTLVFLHGIGNTGKTWDEVSSGLAEDLNIVIVDLLGFGDSPQPSWATYDARTQARSLAKTLLANGIYGKITLIGHSMGSLIAVEFAKRYPGVVAGLVLCSPPIYNLDRSHDTRLFRERDLQLKALYEYALKNPKNIMRLSKLAKAAKLLNPGFDIKTLNLDTYIAALKANIINQTTLHDIVRIKRPIRIIYGTLDPFVIGENIERASDESEYISTTKFIGGHEIIGRYIRRVVHAINAQVKEAV